MTWAAGREREGAETEMGTERDHHLQTSQWRSHRSPCLRTDLRRSFRSLKMTWGSAPPQPTEEAQTTWAGERRSDGAETERDDHLRRNDRRRL